MDRFDLVAESKTEILLSFMRINNNIITINLDETIIFTKESQNLIVLMQIGIHVEKDR